MLKVSDAVYQIVTTSIIPLEAMRLNLLNLSAYAAQIQPQVETLTWKKVEKGTIVVALSRIAKNLTSVKPLQPQVLLNELSIKSPLCDVTYEKTSANTKLARTLLSQFESDHTHFMTVTHGVNEITIIASSDQFETITNHFSDQPRSLYTNLVGITVTFAESYIDEPNVISAILFALAAKRINLIEIVSTYTALTMVVFKDEMEVALTQLNQLFKKTT